MADLVTLTEAKDHLRLTTTATDADLTAKVAEASQTIRDYLAEYGDPLWDATTAPPIVKTGTLWMLAHLWDNRGDDMQARDEALWKAIQRLLLRLRTPTLA